MLGIEKLISRIFKFDKYFLNLVKVQTLILKSTKGKNRVDDVVSKRRIWSQILKKSIDDLKKVRYRNKFPKERSFSFVE